MPLDNIESPLMFTVTEKPIAFATGLGSHDIEGWKALVRRHPVTGEPHVLHVAKDTYTIVQNKELFETVDKAVAEFAGEHMKSAIISDKVSYLGAQCFRQYIFPTITCELKQRRAGTQVMFRIIIATSFDGSSSIKVLSGAIDGFCQNGMISGEYNQLIQRHTTGAKAFLPNLAMHLKQSLAKFWKHVEVLSTWAQTELKHFGKDEAMALFIEWGFSGKRAESIANRYEIEAQERGTTLWALYSALTYYATHNEGEFAIRDTGKDNVAATLQKRELEVFRLTNSNEWKALAA